MTATRTDDSFDTWKREVDAILVKLCGMTSDCIPDYCYRDAFDAGESAEQVASDAYDNAIDF